MSNRTIEYDRKWREEHRDSIKKSNKKWRAAHKDKTKEYNKKYKEENKDSLKEHNIKWYIENQEREIKKSIEYNKNHKKEISNRRIYYAKNQDIKKAQNAAYRAIKNGELIKPGLCSRCGIEGKRIEGHHMDYSKPLELTWLCPKCHGKTWRKY